MLKILKKIVKGIERQKKARNIEDKNRNDRQKPNYINWNLKWE
jgi:hypothetical protein